ncbi:cytochrome oxidase maturation protein, cbb3-type [Microbulbifer agarilyticus]|uniref:Cytochrome oxidase maturation protein, cbb3-type n=1 Tax=Microbulbifer agarilyticus TaxID=260552 RepID=A0A1Q2M6K9_9GAMM|nr:cbb3-type cytochrome oxidase assembly protein CcoS [Microbulbifer agarilyticus]AQQ68289.1 cytochrome oxidase maturation protein, cbb3-type [Microbulbifer agarilyticus]
MDSIFLLVPIVIVFVACAVKFFFWAVNNGQYDDLETESRRILFEDDRKPLKQADTEQTDTEQAETVRAEVPPGASASKASSASDERKPD